MTRNGTNVGFLNIALIWSRSNVLDSMDGAREGRSAIMASFSGSERKAAVSGSLNITVRKSLPHRTSSPVARQPSGNCKKECKW